MTVAHNVTRSPYMVVYRGLTFSMSLIFACPACIRHMCACCSTGVGSLSTGSFCSAHAFQHGNMTFFDFEKFQLKLLVAIAPLACVIALPHIHSYQTNR